MLKKGTVVEIKIDKLANWKGVILRRDYTSLNKDGSENGEVYMVECVEILTNHNWNPDVGQKLPVWDEYFKEV